MNRKKQQSKQICYSVTIMHLSKQHICFSKSLTQNAWGHKSVTPFANRKDECERQKKMLRKFINQAAKVWIKPLSLLSIWAAVKNLNRVDQSSRYYKFDCKKLMLSLNSSTWISSSKKNELIDSKNESLTVSATIYPISTRNLGQMRRNRTSEAFQNGRK